jgi:hypothetical protein
MLDVELGPFCTTTLAWLQMLALKNRDTDLPTAARRYAIHNRALHVRRPST